MEELKDKIEITYGEYTIPEGYDAEIRDGKVIVRKSESEDERIRKELINYFYEVHDDDEERARWIAWLEKQGEQKPIEWSKNDEICRVYAIRGLEYYIKEHPDPEFGNATPCEKAAVRWLKSLENRVLTQPKQEWSEEDEKYLNIVYSAILSAGVQGIYDYHKVTNNDVRKWLDKSLRPQKQWKPTKAMLEALKWAKCEFHPDCPETMEQLKYLYNELKQLYYDRS